MAAFDGSGGANGWNRDERMVLARLDGIDRSLAEIKAALARQAERDIMIAEKLAKLEVKAGLWGALGGMIPVGVGLLAYFVQKMVIQ